MKSALSLFRTERFLPLFITQFFGAFNDNAFKNAFLIWFTYDMATRHAMSGPLLVTLAAGLFILPFFIFSATAGQLADKYEKSFLVVRIKLAEIVLMLLCAIGFYFESVYGLLCILFLMGVQSTFFGPIKYSLLPEHLKDNELIAGNGLIEGGTFLSILLGTIFGGLVVRTENGPELLSLAVVFFAVVGWLSARKIPRAPVGDRQLKIGWNIAAETWKVMSYAKKHRIVWLSIVGISWFWFVGATFLTQFPIYTTRVIGGDEGVVTLFLTLFSVGIGVGSMLCSRLLKGKITARLVPVGSAGITASILLFTFASVLYRENFHFSGEYISVSTFLALGFISHLIIISLLLLSVFAGLYIVPLYTFMQHYTQNAHLARTVASNNVLNALFMVISSLGAIALFSAGFDVNDVLLSVGILNIGALFLVLKIARLH